MKSTKERLKAIEEMLGKLGERIAKFEERLDAIEGKRATVTKGGMVLEWWNMKVYDFPKLRLSSLRTFGDTRLVHWNRRLEELGLSSSELQVAIENQLSKGLCDIAIEGRWFCLDWLIKSPDNMAKFLEGNYEPDVRPGAVTTTPEEFY